MRDAVQAQVKSGGSAECIWSLSRRCILACLAVLAFALVGCGSSPDAPQGSSPGVTQSVDQPAQALSAIEAMTLIPGSLYTHVKEDARWRILSTLGDDGKLSAAIGINGSQVVIVRVSAYDFFYRIAVNSDWHLVGIEEDNIE
jgi:hypothetical protein